MARIFFPKSSQEENVKRASLLLVLASAVMLLAGCPGPTDPTPEPVLDGNTRLSELTVDHGQLGPLFSTAITSYEVGVAKTTGQVTFTAQAESPKAKVSIDGTLVGSKTISITGETTVVVKVIAENGNEKSYTVTVKPAATDEIPVSFLVVESVNGTIVRGADIIVLDDQFQTVVGKTATSDASGLATIQLAPEASYTFQSAKNGHASNSHMFFYVDALGGNTIPMVNQRLGMITREAIAPMVVGIGISYDGVNIEPYEGTALDTSGTCFLVVSFAGKNAIEPTAWSGFGAKLDFNRTPTSLNGTVGTMLGRPYTHASMPGMAISDYVFDFSGMEMPDGYQKTVLVGYDVANNRCEASFPVKFLNNPVGADISAAKFDSMLIDVRSYPVTRGFFSKDGDSFMALGQYEGRDISYRNQLSFKFLNATDANVSIRGFDVYRSSDNVSFVKVGSQSYGRLSSGSGGVHSFFDTDSRLETGTTYYYKVVAYTDAFNTKESGVVQTYLSAPFSYNLTAPLNRATVSAAVPHDYSFTISNTELWNASKADLFYFSLIVRKKTGDFKFIGQFGYHFGAGIFITKYANGNWYQLSSMGLQATDISYAAGVVTIKAAVLGNENVNWALGKPMEYEVGTAYQWDITGDVDVLGGVGHPAWFEKATDGGTTKSYGNGYNEGGDAINGRFEFSVAE